MILLNIYNSNKIQMSTKIILSPFQEHFASCLIRRKIILLCAERSEFNSYDTISVGILHSVLYVCFLTITKLNQNIKHTYVKIQLYCFLLPEFFHKWMTLVCSLRFFSSYVH